MRAVPVTLAIETSQHRGSVALRARDKTIHVEHVAQTGRHDDDLMPAIDRLRLRVNLQPQELDHVAVSIGPGGFTGLRIAVSTAKMMSEALGTRIIAVPSALVAAENLDFYEPSAPVRQGDTILVALASKQETFWGTRLSRDAGRWRVVDEPGLLECQGVISLAAYLAAVICDKHLPIAVRDLFERTGVPMLEPRFDAAACLRVAERKADGGCFADPLSLMPLYPRPPEAVSLWEARKKPPT